MTNSTRFLLLVEFIHKIWSHLAEERPWELRYGREGAIVLVFLVGNGDGVQKLSTWNEENDDGTHFSKTFCKKFFLFLFFPSRTRSLLGGTKVVKFYKPSEKLDPEQEL